MSSCTARVCCRRTACCPAAGTPGRSVTSKDLTMVCEGTHSAGGTQDTHTHSCEGSVKLSVVEHYTAVCCTNRPCPLHSQDSLLLPHVERGAGRPAPSQVVLPRTTLCLSAACAAAAAHRVIVVPEVHVAVVQVGQQPALLRGKQRQRVTHHTALQTRLPPSTQQLLKEGAVPTNQPRKPAACEVFLATAHHGSVGCRSTPLTRSVR